MAEDVDKQDSVAGDESEAGAVAGERLAAARREQQIPILEIAKELHLDEHKVRALEENEFGILGAPVFAKGHLRKYAALVGVDEADVMADYYEITRASDAVPLISVMKKPRREFSPGPWIVVVMIAAVAAAAYWWFVERQPAVAPSEDVSAPAPGPVEAQQEPVVVDLSVERAPSDAAPAEEPVDLAESQVAPPIPVASADMQLAITYSGDCWTEITDAQGRRLFFGLGTSGRTVNLSGEAPFNVLFGDADNVSLVVNNKAYAIQASDRRGRTARMTITDS